MADLVMAGSSSEFEEEPVTAVFTRSPVKGELETLISAQLDQEEGN
jgi:hypothetical protein